MPIPKLNPDKCAQRNRVAARRDGVTTVPLRFLKSDDARKFFLQPSPHNRGGMGRLPKTDAEEMDIINSVAPRGQSEEPLTKDDVYVHYLEAANSQFIPDRYMFLGDSTLKNIATDAATGFAFMNSHRTGGLSHPSELPYGRTFCGRFETVTDEMGTRTRAVVGCYMMRGQYPNGQGGPSTDDLHAGIDGGTIFDVSVGLWGGELICDVCGNGLYEYLPYNAETEEGGYYLCPHVPGSAYRMTEEEMTAQKERGVTDGCCSCTLNDSHCGEVSAVYDGAVPGAGFRKALEYLKRGDLPETDAAKLQSAYRSFLPGGSKFSDKSASEMGDLSSMTVQEALALFGLSSAPEKTEIDGDNPKPELSHPNTRAAGVSPTNVTAAARGKGETMSFKGKFSAALSAALAAVGITNDAELTAALGADASDTTATPETAVIPAAVQSQLEALTNRSTDLEKQLKESNERAEKAARAAQLTTDLAWIETQKREFRITPAVGDKLAKVAEENPEAFALLKEPLSENGPVVTLAGLKPGERPAGADGAVDGAEFGAGDADASRKRLEELTKQKMEKDPKASYADAFSAVCRENPDLARSYRAAASAR